MLKIRKTFKYRLWPSRKQRESLRATLEVCRDLYNDALQERRDAWKTCRQAWLLKPLASEGVKNLKYID